MAETRIELLPLLPHVALSQINGMTTAQLKFPQKGLEPVLHFVKELEWYSQRETIQIDMNERPFMSPFAMLIISAKLNKLKRLNNSLQIEFKNHTIDTHASHMGFFKMSGFDFGRDIGEAYGSIDYIPITQITRSSLYEVDFDKYREIGDLVQRSADRISEVISRDHRTDTVMYDTLSYSIREVMRNVFEHSGSDELYYCAQYWPKINKVEFSIVDFGIGIRRSLSTNPNFSYKTDKEAIEHSLLPGVSGKTHLPRTSDNWFNSGYGLYMISRLARINGNFVIVSGSSAVQLSKKSKNNFSTAFSGTAIRFNIDVSQINSMPDRLRQFRDEADEIAKKIKGSPNRPPSAMSLLLRRDYS